MAKNLIIVESPTKARTLSGFLGSDFVVESSFGHVRDLPKSQLGIDTEHDFEPKYVIPLKAKPKIKELKKKAEKADSIILATDEDREGEAIAWHLTEALGLGNHKLQKTNSKQSNQAPSSKFQAPAVERIVFHEITKRAIDDALKNPRAIDMRLVDAQQARRILDRLVGYKLSPFLWKKVYRGLSAGRVQSPAVRLIVEREREIQAFKPQEYWTISAILQNQAPSSKLQIPDFEATLAKINGKILEKFSIKTKKKADAILDDLKDANWVVEKIEKKEAIKNPLPPFTTSTLQQEAFRRLGFSAKQTMMLAQRLYEGMPLESGPVGLITYMRTDSLNLSEDALAGARDFLQSNLGNNYALPSPRRFKTKSKGAQEAHEAIRPTDPFRAPESIKNYFDAREFKLYNLIWCRFMATQMPSALFDATTIDVTASNNTISNFQFPIFKENSNQEKQNKNNYVFRAHGQVMKFDGFLKIYPAQFKETTLPDLQEKETLDLKKLTPHQHFTEPPPRYTEASLVKTLEQNGIGRPSTYAPTLSTIQERGYVEREEHRALKPTDTGFLVNDILVDHFPEIVDVRFTARMEEDLDRIATGETAWQPIIRTFYEPFAKRLKQKYEDVEKHEVPETTDETCEKCGKPMVVKMGRFGKFLACSGFPECKTTKKIKKESETIGVKCPRCGEGDLLLRRTKKGKRIFFGCSHYPACDYATWEDPRKPKKTTDDNS